MGRRRFIVIAAVIVASILLAGWFQPGVLWLLVIALPLIALGIRDSLQQEHALLRNYPLVGHLRYVLEEFRPQIQQYFIESNIDAYPVEREIRALVYQRAKGELDTRPFGTQRDVYTVGYEWASHSLGAQPPLTVAPRVRIGGPDCRQPYDASLLNISAMSFGALSGPALLALNGAAQLGGFAHNTGEGGIADQHLAGGDLIWQIGSAYFGCRSPDGRLDRTRFAEQAAGESVRMIEIKLSQGAKPGHGGVLPGVKVSPEIARIRHIEPGRTIVSPPSHVEFDNAIDLLKLVAELRELAGGKPVGFKLCIGRRSDFFAICKAMLDTGITPDFITVDGGEGGTGAAPLEFSNSVGMPARDAWVFVHNALVGVGLRQHIRIIASGKIFTGFHMLRALAIGADLCASARGMMFALGCIQSLRCNSNLCPTGITTQDPRLVYGLDVTDKRARVARYHQGTVHSFLELLGAMGLGSPDQLAPHHIFRRVDDLRVRNLAELYEYLEPGQLLDEAHLPEGLRDEWHQARPDRWSLAPEQGSYGGRSLRQDDAAEVAVH